MHPITIENDAVSIEVWPQFGGKVSSVVDKADNFELLFSYPTEFPSGPQYDSAYNKTWYAGWDECFPAILPCKYVRHPYEGISIPDHGELWGLPTTAVPTKDGITTVWHGLRFGYRLTRKLYLEEASVVAEYTLVNLAPVRLSTSSGRSTRSWHRAHRRGSAWRPTRAGRFDSATAAARCRSISHSSGRCSKADSIFPIPRECRTGQRGRCFHKNRSTRRSRSHTPSAKRSLQIEYASESGLAAYWGIWINTGGWGGHRHFAIEPSTGRFDQIDRSMRDGSAGLIGPLGTGGLDDAVVAPVGR